MVDAGWAGGTPLNVLPHFPVLMSRAGTDLALVSGNSAFPDGARELVPVDGSAQGRSSKWDVQY